MSDDSESVALVAILGFAAYTYWTADKPYVVNVKEAEDSSYGENYVLTKFGSGQVAVFHGFVDDYGACEMARQRIQHEGGEYACIPASAIELPKKWWQFWR